MLYNLTRVKLILIQNVFVFNNWRCLLRSLLVEMDEFLEKVDRWMLRDVTNNINNNHSEALATRVGRFLQRQRSTRSTWKMTLTTFRMSFRWSEEKNAGFVFWRRICPTGNWIRKLSEKNRYTLIKRFLRDPIHWRLLQITFLANTASVPRRHKCWNVFDYNTWAYMSEYAQNRF